MVWFKVDDSLYDHPKWRELSLAAQGLWTSSGSYASRHLTDGWVPDWFPRQFPQGIKLARELVGGGLWAAGERDGKPGWLFHDWLDYQPAAATVRARREAESNRQKVQRDRGLREAVQARDGNLCRYCATEVRWNDRRSDLGATYDHINPTGGTSLGNVVVACRGCNSRKGHRTPRQAGMALLPPLGRTDSVLGADQATDQATARVTCRTPMDRDGSGSGTGRDGQDDVPDAVSWDPADYDLADLSDPG